MTLHIYSQEFHHGDSYIVGTPDDLRILGEALIEASLHGVTSVKSFTGDGEGYSIKIANLCDLEMDYLRLPYTHEMAKDCRNDAIHPCNYF